jgi:hypothetical protein
LTKTEHLRALRHIAEGYSTLSQHLKQDLVSTYNFLSAQWKEAGTSLHKYKDEELFLNVDDLESPPCWVAASKLIFNASDDNFFRGVRGFLKSYENLILKAGGKKISAARPIEIDKSHPSEVLASWRENFNALRLSGHFIDIIFIDSSRGEHGAHRVILTCFGEHFITLLCNSGMKEAQDNTLAWEVVRVPLEEYDGSTIQSCLGKNFSALVSSSLIFDKNFSTLARWTQIRWMCNFSLMSSNCLIIGGLMI